MDCVRSHGLPAGFRFAERFAPPFGPTANPQDPTTHRPSACPQVPHTIGLGWKASFPHRPQGAIRSSSGNDRNYETVEMPLAWLNLVRRKPVSVPYGQTLSLWIN